MGFLNDWLLTVLLLIPAIGGAVVPFVRPGRAARATAIGIAVATAVVSVLILIPFHRQQGAAYDYAPAGTVQMLRQAEFLPALHAGYRVAIDGLSVPFVLLTTVLGVVSCAASRRDLDRPRLQLTLLLWLEATTLGVFLSFDLLLLWCFLALSLIPCSGLLWLSSGDRRARVTIAFLWPMLVGLACLLVAALGERLASAHCYAGGTLDLVRLAACRTGGAERTLFVLALIGFLVRLPAFPFHAWLGIAVTESSPAIAAVIGSLVPLTGGYGLFRVVLPLFPAASASLWWVIAGTGLLNLLYHALAAMGQSTTQRTLVQVSFATLGLVLIGSAMMTPAASNGGVFALLSGCLATGSSILLSGTTRDETARVKLPQLGSAGPAYWAAGALVLLVVPGLLGQVIVLLGTIEAAQGASVLIQAHAATRGLLFALALAECVGIALLGAAVAHTMRGEPPAFEPAALPRSTERPIAKGGGVLGAVAAVAILFGVMATPFCFAFTRRALDALMARALHS